MRQEQIILYMVRISKLRYLVTESWMEKRKPLPPALPLVELFCWAVCSLAYRMLEIEHVLRCPSNLTPQVTRARSHLGLGIRNSGSFLHCR